MLRTTLVALGISLIAGLDDPDLLTVAERSDFQATARSSDVLELGQRLAKASPLVHLSEIGKTAEGRSIPLWIVADPPIQMAEAAKKSGKLVVLLMGNIHAGEVDGKEALPMLVRDLVISKPRSNLLDHLILLVVPNFNADGNERVAQTNRPGQIGPEEGMGQRENSAGLDLNRDYMKLDAPETRALVKCFNDWDPHIFFDAHTTNGSHHRYTMTYEGPKNLAGDQRLIRFARERMFPEIGEAYKKLRGENIFFYGNFEQDHTQWTTFPANPRFGTTYFGLRNRMSILSEAYSYVPFKTRVFATRDFARLSLEWAVEHRDELRKNLDLARESMVLNAQPNPPEGRVAIRSKAKAFPGKIKALGYVEVLKDGKSVSTPTPRDYEVDLIQDFEATETVQSPYAYAILPGFPEAVANLRAHGIAVKTLDEPVRIPVESYRVDTIRRSERPYEGHHTVEVEVTPQPITREFPAGTFIVLPGQPLFGLAIYLLEPRSDDGLVMWNFFDAGLKKGEAVPVFRLPR